MIILIMGVSGCGKSTVGKLLAKKLSYSFLEGDELHPQVNLTKMENGIPLTDTDRIPWLKKITTKSQETINKGSGVVSACSALKYEYRTLLLNNLGKNQLVYLSGSIETIKERIKKRTHFMPIQLLESQFAILEPPSEEEKPITIDISYSLKKSISIIVMKLNNLHNF